MPVLGLAGPVATTPLCLAACSAEAATDGEAAGHVPAILRFIEGRQWRPPTFADSWFRALETIVEFDFSQ